ncbi:MAG TPA: ribosome assembly RNA-binding protein YhbY [Clostridiales bacterium]|nr:ribosome assembly RNA-binding protein YhbY [Clostridiales bacterium]HBJ97661.1 ribosome assembly RNA-binding protein YhbY [Clostridiales bacterium]
MLNSKQRSKLRSLAQTEEPIGQIGKGGISEAQVKSFSDAIKKRELIKITVLNNTEDDAFTLGENLANSLQAELVEVIGHKIVLYKPNKDKPSEKRIKI